MKIILNDGLNSTAVRAFGGRGREIRRIQNAQFKSLCAGRGIDVEFSANGQDLTPELYEIWDEGIDSGKISKL